MKKKLIAVGLVIVLTLSMSFTALAAGTNKSKKPGGGGGSHHSSSSSSSSDSGSSSSSAASSSTTTNKNQETTVAKAAPGGCVAANTVSVAIVNADGTVSTTNLGAVINATQATVAASAVSAPQAVATVQALMTTAPTEFFSKTVEALATMKGSAMVVNNCGTVKTAAVATDALGNNIASAGVIPNVTSGALIMLMSVNADGTVEYVEGVVDPVTGAVLGAFQGIPTTITVLVFA